MRYRGDGTPGRGHSEHEDKGLVIAGQEEGQAAPAWGMGRLGAVTGTTLHWSCRSQNGIWIIFKDRCEATEEF